MAQQHATQQNRGQERSSGVDETGRPTLHFPWWWHHVSRWSYTIYWKTWTVHPYQWWRPANCSRYGLWGKSNVPFSWDRTSFRFEFHKFLMLYRLPVLGGIFCPKTFWRCHLLQEIPTSHRYNLHWKEEFQHLLPCLAHAGFHFLLSHLIWCTALDVWSLLLPIVSSCHL